MAHPCWVSSSDSGNGRAEPTSRGCAPCERESELTDAARNASERTRYKLYLWFHARGFSIDKGHEAASLWQSWSDLIDYWGDDDGLRFYPNSTK